MLKYILGHPADFSISQINEHTNISKGSKMLNSQKDTCPVLIARLQIGRVYLFAKMLCMSK